MYMILNYENRIFCLQFLPFNKSHCSLDILERFRSLAMEISTSAATLSLLHSTLLLSPQHFEASTCVWIIIFTAVFNPYLGSVYNTCVLPNLLMSYILLRKMGETLDILGDRFQCRPCPFIQILSRFCPDFIQILFRF